MDRSKICVYLAGPMTGCNVSQRTHWRKEISRDLKELGYKVSDPTDTSARQGAYAVTADIAESDVVIANLWKESIGTVLGIVQARRVNIPVILIDRNYLDSPVLQELVDQVVRTEKAAVNALEELVHRQSKAIHVLKKNGTTATYSSSKIGGSIRGALLQTGCDDSVFISTLLKEVGKRITRTAKKSDGRITTAEIKGTIFETLGDFTSLKHSVPVANAIALLREKWGDFELKKGDSEAYDALIALLENERQAREMAELECANIRAIAEVETSRIEIQANSVTCEVDTKFRLRDSTSLEEFFSATNEAREHVVVRTSAKRSFRDSPYSNRDRMLRVLSIIRDALLISKVADTREERFAAWDSFKAAIIDGHLVYGKSATDIGRGQFSEEHTVKTSDGRAVVCEKIRDMGRTFDRQNFLCIYFAWDDLEKKLHLKSFDHGQTINDHT